VLTGAKVNDFAPHRWHAAAVTRDIPEDIPQDFYRDIPLERRRHQRSRLVEVGRIDAGTGTLTSCVVRNLSPAGAAVMVMDAGSLPDHVLLTVQPRQAAGFLTRARVVWRQEGLCGLEFLDDGPPEPVEPQPET
jgi:PilZ domain